MSGIAGVQARIASLESRMAQLAPAVARATTAAAAPAPTSAVTSGTVSGTTPRTTPGATPGATAAAASTASASAGFSDLLADLVGSAQGTGAATATAGASSGAPAGGPSGPDLVAAAKDYLGVPYRWGGTDPKTGLDCSGLVQRAFADLGVDVPRVAKDQGKLGTAVRGGLDAARPGDLVVMDGGSHIGIYVGDGKMLHAPRKGDVVKISDVWEAPTSIRRVLGEEAAASAGAGAGGVLDASAARPSAIRSSVSSDVARFEPLFAAATAKHDLPPGLLAAVAQQESGGNARAVSPAGARGLMQIMPATARGLGVDPMVPAEAVDGAARLLSQHLRDLGSVPLALAAYNAGPGAVAKYDGIPPYRETQDYVKKITAALGMAS